MAVIVACWALFGCSGTPAARVDLDPRGEIDPRPVLGPGDQLQIRFLYTPNLNATQTVRRDGKLSLALVGDVEVAGSTPQEVSENLKKLYSKELVDPEITVTVTSQWARRVYVGGEVRDSGPISLPAQLSVLEAIMQAGGPKPDTAELSTVLIIRHEGGKTRVGIVDVAKALGWASTEPGEELTPFYLKPGDIVYVPQTKIVQIDRWLKQHIHEPLLGAGVHSWHGNGEYIYDLGP